MHARSRPDHDCPSKKERCRRTFDRCDLEKPIKHALREEFLSQPEWFVDAEQGDDRNGGKSEGCALRTWAELVRRIGIFTTLDPSSEDHALRIHVLSDLPPDDPITFRNFLAAGVAVFIEGELRVLASGTLSDATDKDRLANLPYTISTPGLVSFIGRRVRITSGPATGASAWIARSLGGDRVHVSEWTTEIPFPGGSGTVFVPTRFLGPTPQAGDSFEVVAEVNVNLAELVGGGDPALASLLFSPGVEFRHLTVRAGEFPRNSLGTSLGTAEFAWRYAECRFETSTEAEASNNEFSNCASLRTGNKLFGQLVVFGGLWLALFDGGFGSISSGVAGTLVMDGDPTFVGRRDLGLFMDLGLAEGEQIYTGSFSIWDCQHAINAVGGGVMRFNIEGFSPFFREFGVPQVWGDGNLTPVVIQNVAAFIITGFNVGGGPPPVPTLANIQRPEGWVFTINDPADETSFAWDKPSASYAGPFPDLWPNLVNPAAFARFVDVQPGGTKIEANSINPAHAGHITYESFVSN